LARALRAVPAWGWLALLIFVSFVLRASLARGMVAPFIMVDELVYSELAKSLAEKGQFLVRGVGATGYSLVYPLLISPAYGLFDNLTDAYAAVKTINALVMSLAAVPAYLLARRVVAEPYALFAAALALAIPSMAYTGTVMSENAFYPVFLVAAFVLVLVLEDPTWRRQGALLVVLAIAYATRQQALALVPALLTAPLLLAVLRAGGLRATLRPFASLYAVIAALAAIVLVAQLARGRSPTDLLGAYSVVGETHYHPADVLRYLAYHWAELDLYLGIVPLAATVVLLGSARKLEPRLQAMVAGIVALSFWLVLVVAAFASAFAFRIQERNTFVVAPLFLILLLAWVERGAPRPRWLTLGTAVGCALLVLAIPFERFIGTPAISDTLMLLPWWSVQDTTGLEWIAEIVFALAVALAAAFVLVPRRYALALPIVVLAYFVAVFKPVWSGSHGLKQASAGALFQGIRGAPRDWIDEAVPAGSNAEVLWTGRADRFTVNINEFFNRAVADVLFTSAPTPGGIGERRVQIDPVEGLVRDERGRPVRVQYVLTDGSITPDGKLVARDRQLGTALWRVDGELVSTTTVVGLYPEDTWSGPAVTWTRRRCHGGDLRVALSSDPTLFPDQRQRVDAVSTGGRDVRTAAVSFPSDKTTTLRVPMSRGAKTCVVRFRVTPTATPGKDDPRELGAHFNAFVYHPAR
jgi:Dolichyl-phosphate-mannose-protein mannosyltransferase